MPILNSDAPGQREPGEQVPAGRGGPTPPLLSTPAGPPLSPELRQLDPRRIPLERTSAAIGALVIVLAHLVAVPIVWLTGWPQIAVLLAALAWPANVILQVWLVMRWPVIDYRHWRYRVDAEGIQIWSGVIWRQVVAVPRSRVQHIDVSQGPLERSYGLATLSIYTAGTRFSKVDLPGLDHSMAVALRDALLPKDAEPAV